MTRKDPILIAAFGAMSPEAREVYGHLEGDLREKHPDAPILWAYTAKSIVSRLRANGEQARTLTEALSEVRALGATRADVLSLHLVPGEKHQEILDEDPQGLELRISSPLLGNPEDIRAVTLDILEDLQSLASDCPALVVAHGHGHHEGYNQALWSLGQRLKESRPDTHLTLLEGDADPEGLEAFIEGAQAKDRVHVYPFLWVAGDHLQNDILGDDPESFRSRFAVQGFSCGDPLGARAWARQRFINKIQ